MPGELLFRGAKVINGYWNNREATRKAIVDGWLHTGDVAMIDEDGFVSILDRIKDMIIRGGENIYSVEVENVLYRHPAVLETAVIGVPDEVMGEEVKAFIVFRDTTTCSGEEIRGGSVTNAVEEIIKDTRHFDQERFVSISAKMAKELARTKAAKRWKKLKNIE